MRLVRGRRSGTPADFLVIGLGNPGAHYERTRHNVGAEVVAILAARHGEQLRHSKERSLAASVRIDGRLVALAFPQTYMNDSGLAAGALYRRHGIEGLERMIVVHDELDLPVGRLQVKEGGGLAGHNGLRSLEAHLHGTSFLRVRIGVGRPPGRKQGADHVLRNPTKAERAELDVVVQEAADAVETIVTDGVAVAMSKFNGVRRD